MRDPQETFGERLGIAVKMAGMTQRQAAEEIGVTEVSLGRYIHNQRRPDVSMIVSMVRVLHCDADWLLGIWKDVPEENMVTMSYMQALMAAREFSKSWTTQQRLNVIREILTTIEREADENV